MYSKNTNDSDKSCADFSLKMHKKKRSDPLGELSYSATPDLLAGFEWWQRQEKDEGGKAGADGR